VSADGKDVFILTKDTVDAILETVAAATTANASIASSGFAPSQLPPRFVGGLEVGPDLSVESVSNSRDLTNVGLLGTGGLTVDLVRAPEISQAGIITVSLPKGTTASGSGFTFSLRDEVEQLLSDDGIPDAQLANGGDLPEWLSFEPKILQFSSIAVPDGAFPIEVIINTVTLSVRVVISEQVE
jgi:hypothetical protein